ncbi:MAG: hypothetical protein KDJ75_03090 [Alphaproteobacteria bacterium]|nr:hypothetical protein [Alphaproteobacteria bacterium]
MSLSAASTYIDGAPTATRPTIGADFMSVCAANHNNIVPFAGQANDKPSAHIEQAAKVRGAQANVDNVIRVAFGQQKELIRIHGLAEAQNGQLSSVFSPVNDGMLYAAAVAVPQIGFAALGVTGLSVYNYWKTDRDAQKKKPGAKTSFMSDEFGYRSTMSEHMRQIQWNKPGFYRLDNADEDGDEAALSEEEIEYILRPLKDDPHMRIFLGQQQNIENAQTNLDIREEQGVEVNSQTGAAALQKGKSDFLYDERPLYALVA